MAEAASRVREDTGLLILAVHPVTTSATELEAAQTPAPAEAEVESIDLSSSNT